MFSYTFENSKDFGKFSQCNLQNSTCQKKLVGTKEELLGLVKNQFEPELSFLQLSHISKTSGPIDDRPSAPIWKVEDGGVHLYSQGGRNRKIHDVL